MVKVKRFMGIVFLFIILLIIGVFFAKNFILKEVLKRRLTSINNAPVYIGEVDLSPFDNYIIIKNIKIKSALNEDVEFISIDELKSYYSINYIEKRITLSDTEIENINFFEEIKEDKLLSKDNIFSEKMSKAEENYKRNEVLSELKKIYLEKIDVDSSKIDQVIKEKYSKLQEVYQELDSITRSNDFDDIKNSFKNLKEIRKNKENIPNLIKELSNIGKSTKKIMNSNSMSEIKDKFDTLRKNEEFKSLLDNIVREFLNKNRFILTDLDSYINLYLNVIYEEKIYKVYLKYLKLIDEIEKRKTLEKNNQKTNKWELYFKSISLTSNMYGINFNGEIKNFSSKISRNKNNINFKLFGEKGETIGEFRGHLNLVNYQVESKLNIPEMNSKDFNSQFIIGGEGTAEQYLSTNRNYMNTKGTVSFKNLELNGEELAKVMKIEDDLLKELIIPILSELKYGSISYKYDTKSRNLDIKTNFSEIFQGIINDEDSSLKIKIRDQIKEKYLNDGFH